MDSPFSEGEQPPSYTNQRPVTGADQQSSCVSELSHMSTYYTPSPVAQELSPHPSDSGSLTPASTLYQYRQNPRSTQSPGALPSMTSNPQNVPRSHVLWPSPPPGSDEFDNYSNNSSPTCGSSQNGYNASPVSPRTWPSPHYTGQQTSDPFPQLYQRDPVKLHMCTPASTGSFHVRSSPALMPLAGTVRTADAMPRDDSLVFHPDLTYGAFSATSSPATLGLDAASYAPIANKGDRQIKTEPGSLTNSGSTEPKDQGRTNKGEVPYAQLIYRAFMSRPDHSMSLQEIYQWFRENTDRTKSAGKGWQNSIRHNLSMNAAFTKRDRKTPPPSVAIIGDQAPMPAIHDPKKSTEWVLADWAVRNGVQSTTRYRKGNPSRSRGHSKLLRRGFQYGLQHNGARVSTRAASGRKSGCAASRAKLHDHNFNQETHMVDDVATAALTHGGMAIGPHSIRPMMAPGIFSSLYDEDQVFIKQEPGCSPTPEPTDLGSSFGLTMPVLSLSHQDTSAAIQDATCYQGSVYGHFAYGVNEIENVFHQHHVQEQHPASTQAPLAAGLNGHHLGTMF